MYIYIKIGLVLFLFVHFAENSWSRSNYAFFLVENIHYSWCKKNKIFSVWEISALLRGK
jgi:hypothetical protein